MGNKFTVLVADTKKLMRMLTDKDGTLDGQGWNIGWTRMEHWMDKDGTLDGQGWNIGKRVKIQYGGKIS